MPLTDQQKVALFACFNDFGDHKDELLIDVARFISFAVSEATPQDPEGVLYGMISALGSQHECLGMPGTKDVEIAIFETVKRLVRLSDERKAPRRTGAEFIEDLDRDARRLRRARRQGKAK